MRQHPPGPKNYNERLGLTWRHGLELWFHPLAYATKLARTYGDLTFFRVFGKRLYLVNHPALIREVLIAGQKTFQKLEHSRRVLGSGFASGLILSEGEGWLHSRRMLSEIFDAERMAGYADVTVKHTRRMLDRWRHAQQINTGESMVELTLPIIGEILFHADLSREAPELARASLAGATIFAKEEYAPFVLPDWLPLPSKRIKREVNGMFRLKIGQLLYERRQSSHRGDDLLELLLEAVDRPAAEGGISVEQAIDEAMTLFHGGYHSSSMGLTWCLYLLAQHPEIMERVAAEADEILGDREPTLEDVAQLEYTEMVLKESLRIYPPAWELFARENTADVELGGFQIEKGGIFLLYPLVTHRDERFFPEPLKFDPERFSHEREREIPNVAYFPFGAGLHACIGKTLAMMEMTIILAMIAREFSLSRPAGERTQIQPQALIAIRPNPEIVLVPQVRRSLGQPMTAEIHA
ncbi:MAG TPA: cytochrome P450 [Pirellulaceae bacterium]|nr:cytochrome P450 [Pirellulaceae bacterium]